MAKLLAVYTHHDDSAKSPWKALVESEADALEAAIADDFGMVLREPAADVLARAKEAGRYGTLAKAVDQGYEDDDAEDDGTVVVWFFEEEGKTNWGCGLGSSVKDTNKRENCWISAKEWVPEAARAAELQSLSKDDLVQRLLEVEAVR